MRALVLSGGGTRGAWQIGALRYLRDQNERFDFVSGSSIGALTAIGLAMYPPERFSEAVDFVESIWRDHIHEASDVWRLRFPLGIPGLWNQSFGDHAPLKMLIDRFLDEQKVRASGISLRLPAVDLLTGEMKVFDETTPDLASAVLASASIPILFPPVAAGNQLLADGGIRDYAPVSSAISAGATQVRVLLTENPHGLPTLSADDLSGSISVARRVLRIVIHELVRGDIAHCRTLNTLLDKKLLDPGNTGIRRIPLKVIHPSVPLMNGLRFSAATIQEQIVSGYADAKLSFDQPEHDH